MGRKSVRLQHKPDPAAMHVDMRSLKGMVIGRADTNHSARIKIWRVAGGVLIGQSDDVWVESWEPVDEG